MSSYKAEAINPKTGKLEMADFIDNYFGRHRYGVRFSDNFVHPEYKVRVPKNFDQTSET